MYVEMSADAAVWKATSLVLDVSLVFMIPTAKNRQETCVCLASNAANTMFASRRADTVEKRIV